MDNETLYKGYLRDCITLIKKQALETKSELDNPKEDFDDFEKGFLMGYYTVIKLMKDKTFAFDIDQRELGLADIDPDKDLLRSQTKVD